MKCQRVWQMQGDTLVINPFAFEKPNDTELVSVCIKCRRKKYEQK